MNKIALLLLSMFCTGHGQQMCGSLLEKSQPKQEVDALPMFQSAAANQSSGQDSYESSTSSLKALAMLLLAFNSPAAFDTWTARAPSTICNPKLASLRPAALDRFFVGLSSLSWRPLRQIPGSLFQNRCESSPHFLARVRRRTAYMTGGMSKQLGLIRDSALPLCGKRILLPSPRTEAASLMSALSQAGARPIWCPCIRVNPLSDPSDLDNVLMRLVDYDVLIFLSPHSVDALAGRFLSFVDGAKDMEDMVGAMIEASDVQIGAIGSDAVLFRKRFGSAGNVIAPVDQQVRGLAKALVDLEHVKPGAQVLVTSGGGEEQPKAVGIMVQEMKAAGASVDIIKTHAMVTSEPAEVEAELGLVRKGYVDAICASSAEELSALFHLAAAQSDDEDVDASLSKLTILALGEETADAARELAPSAELLVVGARPGENAIVKALEQHFGAGKLLI